MSRSGPTGRFPREARIRERWEFNRIHQEAPSVHTGSFTVLALPCLAGARPRLGCAISKKVGGAVVRNRIRRWVREVFRARQQQLPPVDLVVVAKPEAAALSALVNLEAELGPAFEQVAARAMGGQRRRGKPERKK
ncbi:MAG: ribonuclease P protein component [Deltaproteobacteria bacterium]|nr:ribonuclease P protein component [Deltaproteobacteria bacterium]